MIGGEPARPLPLGREDDRRADRALRRALREGRDVQQADRRPRRVDAADAPPTCPTACSFLPIKEGNVRVASFFGLMESTLGGGAALRADDAGLVALGGRRRRERVLVPVARSPTWRSRSRSSGASWPSAAMPTRRRRASTSPPARQRDSIIGDPCGASSGAAAAGRRLAGQRRTTDEYSRMRTSNTETLLIGGELDFATPPQDATKDLLPVPAERPPGRAARVRALGERLDAAARSGHAG